MLSNRPLWRLLYFVFLRHWMETTAGPTECLHSKDTSTTPFRGCRSRLLKFKNSLGPDQAWQNARHILSSLIRFLTVCYFQVLLFWLLFYYLSAQEQGPISSSQRSLGHSIFEQKFSQKFLFFFRLFVVVVFYFIKISRSGESRKHAIKIIAQMRDHAWDWQTC